MFFRSKKDEGGIAVAEPDEPIEAKIGGAIEDLVEQVAPPSDARPKKKTKKDDDDDLEYEWEFATPFGKIEFELDTKDVHEAKERKRREKAERDAAKKAERIAKQAAKEAEKRGIAGPVVIVKRSNLVPALVIFAIVAAGIAIAFWLFARPGEDDDDLDAVPPELRTANALAGTEPAPPSGIRGRIQNAIRAGRKASRDAQREQEQRYNELAKRE